MPFLHSCRMSLAMLWLALTAMVIAQQISPSNVTSDIPSYSASPRFWVNGSDFDHFSVVPLGWFARISQSSFVNIYIDGRLVLVDSSNANNPLSDGIVYISCDPKDYPGVLGPNDVLGMAANAQPGNTIILYSTRSNHCEASNLRSLAAADGVFTTLDPVLAATVASQISNSSNGMPAVVVPDFNSYQNPGNSNTYTTTDRPGPTTAVAMIILYTITGLITALFVVIIVTGAIRAHRHPERYGPSSIAGRPRRSRAKGIARAMLDTIPIVKFGEKDDTTQKAAGDVEMATTSDNSTTTSADSSDKTKSATVLEKETGKPSTLPTSTPLAAGAVVASSSSTSPTTNPDGTDDSGQLGCSICTEDFTKGEEVRVLPCNHKFHPECVDPWLLNVSGTCPLCRVDLRPKEEQEADAAAAASASRSRSGSVADGTVAPPLGGRRGSTAASGSGRRDTLAFASLRSVASASREDRIAALRRFRQQRRGRGEAGSRDTATGGGSSALQDEERRGLSARLRERFRVRTGRQGDGSIDEVRT